MIQKILANTGKSDCNLNLVLCQLRFRPDPGPEQNRRATKGAPREDNTLASDKVGLAMLWMCTP